MARGLRPLLATAVLAVALTAAPGADAATRTPVRIMGTISAPAHVGARQDFRITYHGRLPTLHRREYMGFSSVYVGRRASGCQTFGSGVNQGVTRPRLKTDFLRVGIPVFYPNNYTRWCSGKWLVQYQLMTPFRPRGGGTAWHPRLTIAYNTKLRIG